MDRWTDYIFGSSMFYFTRAVPTGWAFLQGTLGMFLCVIQIQGEMEPDDIQLEACWELELYPCELELYPRSLPQGIQPDEGL